LDGARPEGAGLTGEDVGAGVERALLRYLEEEHFENPVSVFPAKAAGIIQRFIARSN
jgi:hypothetical protein